MIKGLKQIEESSLTFLDGFTTANTQEKYKDGNRQINWDMVKKIIDTNEYEEIQVGLAEDWELTSAYIFKNGYTCMEEKSMCGFYGSSAWATPAIKLTKGNESILYECWILGKDSDFPAWLKRINEN